MPTPRLLTTVLLGLAIPALLAMAPAAAQKAGGDAAKKKLYCWDQNGTRMCSDTLPQEAVNRAREEINASSGKPRNLPSGCRTRLPRHCQIQPRGAASTTGRHRTRL